MTGSSNAAGNGFIASLAKPGGNITGLSTQAEEVLSKSIEYLHEAAPAARRIAILLNETHPSLAVFWASAQAACAALDLSALHVVAKCPGAIRSCRRADYEPTIAGCDGDPGRPVLHRTGEAARADANHPAAGGVWNARGRHRWRRIARLHHQSTGALSLLGQMGGQDSMLLADARPFRCHAGVRNRDRRRSRQRSRPHQVERREADCRVQGHAQAAEGDQCHSSTNGSNAPNPVAEREHPCPLLSRSSSR